MTDAESKTVDMVTASLCGLPIAVHEAIVHVQRVLPKVDRLRRIGQSFFYTDASGYPISFIGLMDKLDTKITESGKRAA